jgi:hypothetical protein
MRRSRNLSYASCEQLGGVAFQDHPAPGGHLSHDQHPREHLNVLVRQRYGGAVQYRTSSDKSTYSGPHPKAAATPARNGLPLSAAAGSKLLSALP